MMTAYADFHAPNHSNFRIFVTWLLPANWQVRGSTSIVFL